MLLSAGAQYALGIAARKAMATWHKDIQKGHILIGICSMEEALKTKYPALGDVLNRFGINLTQLGEKVRKGLGCGKHIYTDNNTPSMSPVCNSIFERAKGLAGKGEISSLPLLSALLKEPDDNIKSALEGIDTDELANQVLACTRTTEDAPMKEFGEVVTVLKEFIRKVEELVKVNEELVSILKEKIKENPGKSSPPLERREDPSPSIVEYLLHKVVKYAGDATDKVGKVLSIQLTVEIIEGVVILYYFLGIWHFLIGEKLEKILARDKGIVGLLLAVSVPFATHFYIHRKWWKFGVSLAVFVATIIYAFIVTFRV